MKLLHPFSAIIAGSSGTGKTQLVRHLLEDFRDTTTIDIPRLKVWWCHGQHQDLHNIAIPNVEITYFTEFVSDFGGDKPDIVIYDDMMGDIAGDRALADVFTKKRHHEGISVFFIVQNLFFQAKEMRTVSLNCMYFILLKSPRDRLQLLMLGRQVFPGQERFFKSVLDDALKEPFSHLIIDMTPQCKEEHRLRQRVKAGWHVWSK